QPGADDLLVIGQDHADRHAPPVALGRTASTVQPRCGFGPASSAPPSSFARSAMPISPKPVVDLGSKLACSPSSSTVSRTQSTSPWTETLTRVALRAWRTALVIDSWANR